MHLPRHLTQVIQVKITTLQMPQTPLLKISTMRVKGLRDFKILNSFASR
jgi:hypothetical protein